MSATTYHNESPSGIRVGDTVERNGEKFIAYTDAEWVPSELAYNVLTQDGRWKSLGVDDLVSITMQDADEYDYA